MTVYLADGNLLVAMTVVEHVHHDVALEWFESAAPELATCPITEGTLLRFLIRAGHTSLDAVGVLEGIRAQPWHRFWPDDLPYGVGHLRGVIGHRQVTDAYLVALSQHHGGMVATFDKGLAAVHGSAVRLLPG